MASVTGITAERAEQISAMSVVYGSLDGQGALILQRGNGEAFSAGSFRTAVQQLVNSAADAALVNYRQSLVDQGLLIETGMVIDSAAASPPPGYLRPDGSAVSRTTYSKLFAKIGTAYGAGDGTTTFNLPSITYYTPTIQRYIKT